MHVVGFGFDYTENHLWNMLTEKRRLKRQGHDVGDVVFHRCATAEPTVAEMARLSILDALGVTVRDHVAGTYSEAYEKCIDGLARSE